MNVTALKFTTAERSTLEALHAQGFRAETCADDGDEWAALMPTTEDRFSLTDPEAPALSVQLTREPGRRCVVLGADGRELAAGDILADTLAVARHLVAEQSAAEWAAAAIETASER